MGSWRSTVHPKLRRKEHTGRYEAIRPLQLVHLDFHHFHVHRQKQCLLLILDDYSRFITGFTLLKSEHADGAIKAFEESVTHWVASWSRRTASTAGRTRRCGGWRPVRTSM